MAKISVGSSVTVNFSRHTIEFMKLDARIDDIDLDVPVEVQLETFDEKFNDAYNKLKTQIKQKLEEKLRGEETVVEKRGRRKSTN